MTARACVLCGAAIADTATTAERCDVCADDATDRSDRVADAPRFCRSCGADDPGPWGFCDACERDE